MSDFFTSLTAFLDGRKTYIIAALAILYVFGADQGWWQINDSILTVLGFGGLASLRAGVKKSEPK